MDEDNKPSEEFQFTFEVAEGFYENFSSFIPLHTARINGNLLLPHNLRRELILDLEKKALEPKKTNDLTIKSPRKKDISSYLGEKLNVTEIFSDINEGRVEINPEKTKSMMICDLSERNNFVFLLNKEWVLQKQREAKEKERIRLKVLHEEQLSDLKTPYYHDLLSKLRDFKWVNKPFDHEFEPVDLPSKTVKDFRRKMKRIFLKEWKNWV